MAALFRNPFRPSARAAEGAIPAGYRVYAVGDVHGRSDLLDELLALIDRDIERRGKARNILVFLGDLVDRGPDSAGVIERLRTFQRPATRLVVLCGNHEEVLLRILEGDSSLIDHWLTFGGAECLASYGVSAERVAQLAPAEAVALVRSAIPGQHRRFLKSLADTFTVGDYLFVHAGIRPGVPFSEQSQEDLRWIREPFLEWPEPHGFTVVHGHSISEQVEERPNRVGIDTGAYWTGVLTAIALEGDERWFLQTGTTLVPAAEERQGARLVSE